ncbi:HAD-superfamily subfamily IB hydrolase, TIGR01490 [Segniliparus rotundus DSM 44985]|uniref:HAD-superfamily subfamily IB hydrolase, TIGR01490 n=1 Tax=Segniliparus rotundus (strain ATCC BAA-972 / CDC 1076 / CIP 108378 / DSM 44985 / JCM 13578) TaxID=640132 RepID=D6Z822_SEGRD|nr:HAD-IB family hydrolase [Segniliparus rotundus]ADG98102.1 HAD-superfamily subfamily IB hydrolase, TIGR01490 [Segniliparus rotundus DSM 44985]
MRQDRHSLAGEAAAEVAHEVLLAQQVEDEERAAEALEGLELGVESAQDQEEVQPDLTAAAFFDVDNTLVQGASIIHFARGLVAKDYLSTRDIVGFAFMQLKFRLTGKESSEDVKRGKSRALSFIEGRSTAELRRLGAEIYDEVISGKIWPGTRALAQMHLDAGQQVWLVTATPVELAQTIAERLGLTGALGTVAESKDGLFTGRLVGDLLHGLGKAHAVRALAAREGLNLKRCTAYSDSHNDVPMLSLVGTAVAINPDPELREIARIRGWEIRDYRTARKAARIGVPSALAIGVLAGSATAVMTHRDRLLAALLRAWSAALRIERD